jgi:Mg-chelatase subunit ChlD
MKRATLTAILLAFSLLLPLSAAADIRTEPIDVIIALDKSLSMVEEIDAVKEYVDTYLIDELLIPGDFFLVVAFYGKTEIPVSMRITVPEDKEKAKEAINALIADGRFTDIGNALDALGEQLHKYSSDDRKKFLLLITDGIQEAPPASKYYSPDGRFNHAFLENTKVIQKLGWKIHILGVGTHEQAQELAENLAATYNNLSEQPTAEELVQKTQDFLSALEVSGKLTMGPVDYRGGSSLSLTVESQGFTQEQRVDIGSILLSLPFGGEENILPENFSFTVPPGGSTSVEIPVRLHAPPPSGDYDGSVRFVFAGPTSFLPVVMDVGYHVESFLESYWLWLVIGALVVVALVVLLILLIPRLKKVSHRFRLVVEGEKQGKAKDQELHAIKEGRPLYLELDDDRLRVSPQKQPGSLARLTAIQKGVRLTVLKSERFPKLWEVPLDILDFDFKVRMDLERRKDVVVRLARV